MNKIKRAGKNKLIIITIFAAVSFILMIVGGILVANTLRFRGNAVKTKAEIVDTEEWYDSDGERHKRVFVDYEYDGEIYEYVKLNGSMRKSEGSIISIYVNSENPSEITATVIPIGGIMTFCMGFLMALMMCPTFITSIKKNKIKKNVMSNGIVIKAVVDKICLDSSLEVNGRHPNMLKCYYEDIY